MINRIQFSTQIEALSASDFIIEAANEDFELKKLIF
jgi:3-hydroxyacyl-CoA dehydrogenase